MVTTLATLLGVAGSRRRRSTAPILKFSKSQKVSAMSHVLAHKMVLFYSLIPIAIHQLLVSLLGWKIPTPVAFFIHFYGFQLSMRKQGHAIHTLGHKLGYFDGDVHNRDRVPTTGADAVKITWSLPMTVGSRTVLCLILAYDKMEQPVSSLTSMYWWLWLFVLLSLYIIVLDFWYYCVHRCWHEIPFLWKFHRKHHTTKHPNNPTYSIRGL